MRQRKDRPGPSALVSAEALGPFTFHQPPRGGGHRLTTDSVLLVDFVLPVREGVAIADLGTGTGAIPLMLVARAPVGKGVTITGIEIDAGLANIARRNVEENGLSKRVDIVEGDLRAVSKRYPEGSFGLVVSNPPYTKKGAGRVSPVAGRAVARSEQSCSLPELIEAAKHLAGKNGRIAFVYPARRMAEMFAELKGAGLCPVRLKLVFTGKGKEAKLFLIEAGRGGELRVEEPLAGC